MSSMSRLMVVVAALGIALAGCTNDAPPATPAVESNLEQGSGNQNTDADTESAKPAQGSGSSN